MRFWINDKRLVKEIESLKTSIPRAGKEAMQAGSRALAYKLKDRVVEMIPDEGGWYDLYKEAVVVLEVDKDRYEIEAQVNEITFGSIPADGSLIWISAGDDIARILAQNNPWTLDTIPSFADGFTCDLIVRPASESETDYHRRRQLNDMTETRGKLATIGKTPQAFDAELPKINGKVLADIPFLVDRLEYGLGGFPRTPIWNVLDAEFKKLKDSDDVKKAGESVFSKRWRSKK